MLGVGVVYTLFRKYGIYSKTKIFKAIQEKEQAGLTEEQANVQIAQEGNISVEAVARIRSIKEKEEKEREQQQTKKTSKPKKLDEKFAKFKERAAQIPDKPEELVQEFGYSRCCGNIYSF